jgi:hydroxymethylbilane synthase
MTGDLRLGTRESPLAMWQAKAVQQRLAQSGAGVKVTLVPIRTTGDEVQDREVSALGSVNVFTAEVDRAVAEGRADAGVHSLKDLGTQLAPGLVLASVLERGPAEDVLVAPRFGALRDLPQGATVGTGSPRRRAMLLRERPDLVCRSLRGNVQTRLAKVALGEVDAAIMARAGLVRLGLDSAVTELLALDRFLPAAGQGLIGVTCRGDDAGARSALGMITNDAGLAAGAAERAVLSGLHAGCHAPVGAHAVVDGSKLVLSCRVLALDGSKEVAGAIEGDASEAARLGEALARRLLSDGAGPLLLAR